MGCAVRVPIAPTLIALALALALAASVSLAQTNTTTTEYRITIENVTVFSFNVTGIAVGFINSSHMIVTYTCLYNANYTEECTRLVVMVYNDQLFVQNISFDNLTKLCSAFESVCSGYSYVNVSGFSKIVLKAVDADTQEVLQVAEIPMPYYGPRLTGYLSMLYALIPAGIIGGLVARGSLKMIGVGFIVLGLVTLLLPYLGIYPPYQYVLFVFAIIVGLIILWFSRG